MSTTINELLGLINELRALWSDDADVFDAQDRIARTATVLREMVETGHIVSGPFRIAIRKKCLCGCPMPDIDLLQAAIQHLTAAPPKLPKRMVCIKRQWRGAEWHNKLAMKELEIDDHVISLFRENLDEIISGLRSGTGVAETVEQTPELHPAIKDTSETAEDRLLDIKRSGASWTSYKDLAGKTGRSESQLKRVVKENAELTEWCQPKRQSVAAGQMPEDGDANLPDRTTVDVTNAIISPEERDAIRQQVTRYIRERHSKHEEEILQKLEGLWEDLAKCADPENTVDVVAKGIQEEKEQKYRRRQMRHTDETD